MTLQLCGGGDGWESVTAQSIFEARRRNAITEGETVCMTEM